MYVTSRSVTASRAPVVALSCVKRPRNKELLVAYAVAMTSMTAAVHTRGGPVESQRITPATAAAQAGP